MAEILAVGPLTVDYSSGRPFRALNLQKTVTVDEGEIFGLVGPSGCGKSTLLRVVAGLVRNWTGTVRLLGAPWTPPAAGTRMPVQMVFQDPGASLHPWYSIGDSLAEPLRAARESQVRERVLRALDEVDLSPTLAARRPRELSGGQRQRATIARALLLEPRLLLLDEPTSALDVSVQAGVLNLLERLRRDRGMTMVLVSHDPGVVAHLCDRAVGLKAGQWTEEFGRNSLETWG